MSALYSVYATLGGEHDLVVRKLDGRVYEIILPLHLLSDNEKNDLILDLRFSRRCIAEFRHMGRSISLAAKRVLFSGFENPITGEIERFNVSTVSDLKLEGDMLAKAELQDPSITCHVFEIRDIQVVRGFPKCGRTSTDGEVAPVTFTTGKKSRVFYGQQWEQPGLSLGVYTFILRVVEEPEKKIELF
jgi:hypothetical protein